MKKEDKFKVLMRYEYVDLNQLKRMLYIIFSRNGNLFYINDDSEVIQKMDDKGKTFDVISQNKLDYIKYNSTELTKDGFEKIIKHLKSMNANLDKSKIKKIRRDIKISDIIN